MKRYPWLFWPAIILVLTAYFVTDRLTGSIVTDVIVTGIVALIAAGTAALVGRLGEGRGD